MVDETTVSKSRFICYLARCDSVLSAKKFISEIQQKHPQAAHHCSAFVVDRPENSQCYGCSDDGEPSGTAGRPMLAVLQGSHIGEIAAVVVRYFGGTKLGTGGLQRAYGNSVRQALLGLTLKTKIPMVHKTLACSYGQVDEVLRLIKLAEGHIVEQVFQQGVTLTLAIPVSKLTEVVDQLNVFSAGKLQLNSCNSIN